MVDAASSLSLPRRRRREPGADRPLRVLLISDWHELEGGTERIVENLRAGLEESGDRVLLLASAAAEASRVKPEFTARTSDHPLPQTFLQVANPFAAISVHSALRRFRPDAVHVASFLYGLSPAVFAPLGSVPTTLAVLDHKPVCPRGTKVLPSGDLCDFRAGVACRRNRCLSRARAVRDAVRYGGFLAGLRNVDRVIAPSRLMKRELDAIGIDAMTVGPPVREARPGFRRRPAAAPTFVYAGRLAPVKGVDLLLYAFARLGREHGDARLRIRGDGPERDPLLALSARLGLEDRVSFEISMEPDWEEMLEDAWALVAPSLYREPLGLVAIEALMHHVPVIASEDVGLAETVDDGITGLLFPNGDESALVDRLRQVCRREGPPAIVLDPADTRAVARRHNVQEHVREMHQIWRSVGAGPRRSPTGAARCSSASTPRMTTS